MSSTSSLDHDDAIEIVEGMSSLIPPGSLQKLTADEDDEDGPEQRRRSAIVEERLLSFYEHQLEHVHDHNHHAKKIPSPRIAAPTPEPPELPIHKAHAYPCQTTHVALPSPPSQWPQCPVMLRPTPLTHTRIRGIRHASDIDYRDFPGFCAGCILPINTGRELPGQSLVIDFESRHFVGTLLMRIKTVPSLCSENESSESYFEGKKRRFQAVVKGKFKTPLKMSECVTGQVFGRPAGSLPAKWVVTSFVKFVSTLAPQLEASIDGEEPKLLTPLVSTAHTVLEKESVSGTSCEKETLPQDDSDEDCDDDRLRNYKVYAGAQDIEAHVEEPPANDSTSVMKHVSTTLVDAGSVGKRQRVRKKAFNNIAARHADKPCFDLDKEYSFEFYQHLLVFDDYLAIDMGRPIGKVDLAPITDGQPLKFMAAHKNPETQTLENLWSFDIWHESLYPHAQAAEEDGD